MCYSRLEWEKCSGIALKTNTIWLLSFSLLLTWTTEFNLWLSLSRSNNRLLILLHTLLQQHQSSPKSVLCSVFLVRISCSFMQLIQWNFSCFRISLVNDFISSYPANFFLLELVTSTCTSEMQILIVCLILFDFNELLAFSYVWKFLLYRYYWKSSWHKDSCSVHEVSLHILWSCRSRFYFWEGNSFFLSTCWTSLAGCFGVYSVNWHMMPYHIFNLVNHVSLLADKLTTTLWALWAYKYII